LALDQQDLSLQQCHVAPMNCGGFFVGSIWIDVPPGSG